MDWPGRIGGSQLQTRLSHHIVFRPNGITQGDLPNPSTL
jgi:hypothetical protein